MSVFGVASDTRITLRERLARWRDPATRLVFALLLLSYSLPNIIALRNTLTWLAFALVFPELAEMIRGATKELKRILIVFGALICWTLVVAIFVAEEPFTSLREWVGEWLPPAIAFLAGLGVFGALVRNGFPRTSLRFWLVLLIPLTALMTAHIALVIAEYVRVGSISPHFSGFSDHKANVTYAASTLLPFVFAFAIVRADGARLYGKGFRAFVWLSGILAVAAAITSGARNGMIVALSGVVVAGAVIWALTVRRGVSIRLQFFLAGLLVTILFAAVWAGVIWDPRWQRFVQTVPVALDTETHQEWLDPPGSPMPTTSDGRPAEESAYQRIAWAKVGAGMLLEHPFGLEISRNTFHDLVVERYGRGSMAHAHNSIIDFGLNVGFPGLALWFVFIGSLLVTGWRATQSHAAIAGWALIFLVFMYLARSMLDSMMRDHMLEQFMLTAGILLGAIACAPMGKANG